MGEKSKRIKLILIVLVSVIIVGTVVCVSINKLSKNDDTSSTTKNEENKKDNDSDFEVKTKEINVKESSKENALELGEWGNASKAVTDNFASEYNKIGYIEVPTSVTKIIKGKDAENMVKKWYAEKRPNYTYDEPKEDMEWVVIEYKVDLSDVKIRENSDGIKIKLDCSLTGSKGGTSVNSGRRAYILSPYSMSDDVRAKVPGIYTGRIMVKLPLEFSDYTIQLGSSYDNTKEGNKGTIAYFKGQ